MATTMQEVLNLIPVLPTGGVDQAIVASLTAQITAQQSQLATENQAVSAATATVSSDGITINQIHGQIAALQQQLTAAQAKLATDQAALQSAQNTVLATNAQIASLQSQLAAAEAAGTPPPNQSTAIKSGNASDPTIWDQVPQAGFNVIIPTGVSVVWDWTSPRLWRILVQGNLDLLSGQISCDTFVTAMGSNLTAGTPTTPHAGQFTLLIADYGPVDLTKDPFFLSRGVHIMGSVAIYGRKVAERCFTTGNKKGDSVVTLLQPATGWNVGDQIFLPGVGYGTIDDDTATIQAISPDLLTVTLAAPLQFDHGNADRYGNSRPMFAVNVRRRSINVESENKTVIGQRGHWMVMYDPADTMSSYHVEHASFIELGRTDKSKIVTDPDGLGNGLANPRARYAHHFHRCGPDLLDATGKPRMMREVYSCLINGSPGWGLVNHDSHCDFDTNIVINVYGAGIVTEIGTETGCFCDNTICRSRHSFVQEAVDNDRGVADWGFSGVGIWLQGGNVSVEGTTLITGMPHDAVTVMGSSFLLHGNETLFASKNLRAPNVYTASPTVRISNVPFSITGLRFFGCKEGPAAWGLNGGGSNAAALPIIAPSVLSDMRGEADAQILQWGYNGGVNVSQVYGCRIGQTFTNTGVVHTGVNGNTNYDGVTLLGYDVAIYGPTDGPSSIKNITHNANTGIRVWNSDGKNGFGNPQRTLAMSNLTMLPRSATDLAVIARQSHYDFQAFAYQNNVQMNVFGRADMAEASLYGVVFPNAMQGFRLPCIQSDTITLDGNRIYFPEMGPQFLPSTIMPWIAANLPALAGQTNAQIAATYGMAIADTVVPSDVVVGTGTNMLVSNTPPVLLKRMDVNKGPQNYQQTSNPTGYVAVVHDSKGNAVSLPPANLLNPGWTLVTGQVEGVTRSVSVQCDSTKTFPSNW